MVEEEENVKGEEGKEVEAQKKDKEDEGKAVDVDVE